MPNADGLISAGDQAPDFELPGPGGQTVRLSEYRGKENVVLVFYPFTFTAVCQGELCALRDDQPAFEKVNAKVFGVSCDSTFAQAKWAGEHGFSFPLLSDFWPHGAVARAFGVFNEELGCAERTTFVIDKSGRVAARFCSEDIGTPRERADYEAALAGLI